MRPLNKHFSAYTARQVKRFHRDGWTFSEIGARMGMTERDARTLNATKRVRPAKRKEVPRFELVSVQPVREAQSGRSYGLAPTRKAGAA